MYKCCICGKEYKTEKEVVKCVNRCGRAGFQTGKFVKKDSRYSGETTTRTYDNRGEDMELVDLYNKLLDLGAPEPAVKRHYNMALSANRDDVSEYIEEMKMMVSIYGG